MNDTENRDDCICPYCGAATSPIDHFKRCEDGVEEKIKCAGCGNTFHATQNLTITYTTRKL